MCIFAVDVDVHILNDNGMCLSCQFGDVKGVVCVVYIIYYHSHGIPITLFGIETRYVGT